jgi:glycosyltransferase involved in cell wall biosynthesis
MEKKLALSQVLPNSSSINSIAKRTALLDFQVVADISMNLTSRTCGVALRMADTTIVIPCYNEAERLDVVAFVRHVLDDPPHRFLFVNDGSGDTTLDLLREVRSYDADRFDFLDLPQNCGKAEAVRRGVLEAFKQPSKYIAYWDADLATPLDEIETFRSILENDQRLELVLGSRVRMLGRSIQRKPHRHVLGRLFASTASRMLGLGVYDTQCGAKMFRATDQLFEAFQQPFKSKWVFDVELLARMIRHRQENDLPAIEHALYEQSLRRWEDVGGSKVRARDFFKAGLELIAIHRTYLRGLPTIPSNDPPPVAEKEETSSTVSTADSNSRKTATIAKSQKPKSAAAS